VEGVSGDAGRVRAAAAPDAAAAGPRGYTLQDLAEPPNALAPHYSRFRVAERLLLTGHSHQAWPDRAFEGQQKAWLDAAHYADDKWGPAFAKADRVRRGFARLMDDPDGVVALGHSTHDLVVKLLSALPLRERPRIVTTDGEFHSARRQLDRLAEEGIELVKVSCSPAAAVADRLAKAVDDRTAIVVVSCVLFGNAHLVPGLGRVMERCETVGAELLVDAYHALNVLDWSVRREGLERAFVTGGGYKYCQLGEGNSFLRIPPGRELRPVITGWFSEFGMLTRRSPFTGAQGTPGSPAGDSASRSGEAGRSGLGAAVLGARGGGTAEGSIPARVGYGAAADAFASATYDPTSHYRAAAVFDFFEEQALVPAFLRAVSQHQVGLMARCFDELDLDPGTVSRDRSVPLEGLGGFLALKAPRAGELRRALRAQDVWVDHRAETLRLGPAPFLSDRQIEDAVAILGGVARARPGPGGRSSAEK
jgi:kynureninase